MKNKLIVFFFKIDIVIFLGIFEKGHPTQMWLGFKNSSLYVLINLQVVSLLTLAGSIG